MFDSLAKLKQSIEKLTKSEQSKLTAIQDKIQKYISDKKYEEGITYTKSTLEKLKSQEGQSLQNCVKHELVKIINSYIVYLMNNEPTKNIKKYFIESDQYIAGNIYSYIIKQNNYSCYLVQNNHIKQSKNVLQKIQKIEILNYLTNEQTQSPSLNQITKNYSNLSSIENNAKNYSDSLILGMQSLVLSQFDMIFNSDYDYECQSYLGYYTVGVQQEFLKRLNDCKASFAYSKRMLQEENGDVKQYEFIKKIKVDKGDEDIINFKESLANPELTYLKCKKFDPFKQKVKNTTKTQKGTNYSNIYANNSSMSGGGGTTGSPQRTTQEKQK